MVFSKIEEAINDIKRGKFVIVVDDENRENEGDLVLAASKVTADRVNYMIKNARGLVCMPIVKERLTQLGIGAMVNHNEINRCMFSISVDYKQGTTTGISPADRAATISALVNGNTNSEDFIVFVFQKPREFLISTSFFISLLQSGGHCLFFLLLDS